MFSAKKTGSIVMATAVLLAIARTMIVLYNMEQKTPESDVYHMPTNIYVTAFGTVVVLLVLAVSALAIYSGRGKTVTLDDKNASVSVGALLLAFSLIGTVLVYCINHIMADKSPTYIGAFVAMFAVCSGFKFLISGLKSGIGGKESLAGVALFPILLTVFRLLGDFIRTGANPMASSGAYHIVGLSAALLYFLCEGKSYLSECSAKLYNLFAGISVIMLLVYSIPNVMLHCFGVLTFDYYTAFSVVDIATAIYITVRLSTAKYECYAEESEAIPEETVTEE